MYSRIRVAPGIVRPAEVVPEPWANGLGVTRVLVSQPRVRISIAEIEGRMPFSPLPGVDRTLIPLNAWGVALEIGGARHRVRAHEPVRFRGEDEVFAETGLRRTTVVNVMTPRESSVADCEIRRGTDAPIGGVDAIIVLGGQVSLPSGDGWLSPGTVVLPDGREGVVSSEAGIVALVRLRNAGAEASA
jgi:environmental stress-induced protein Ves